MEVEIKWQRIKQKLRIGKILILNNYGENTFKLIIL